VWRSIESVGIAILAPCPTSSWVDFDDPLAVATKEAGESDHIIAGSLDPGGVYLPEALRPLA
jgi:hypothetical protein